MSEYINYIVLLSTEAEWPAIQDEYANPEEGSGDEPYTLSDGVMPSADGKLPSTHRGSMTKCKAVEKEPMVGSIQAQMALIEKANPKALEATNGRIVELNVTWDEALETAGLQVVVTEEGPEPEPV